MKPQVAATLSRAFLLVALGVAGGPASAASAAETAQSAIDDVEQRFARALDARDRPGLEPLLAAQFIWIHASDGRVDPRESWLQNAVRGIALSGQRSERTEFGPSTELLGSPQPHTAIRIARIRLLDAPDKRESWLRQTHVLVRGEDGTWRIAMGQGVFMYDGPVLDLNLHQRYVGTYIISPGRKLVLTWQEGLLHAVFPNGSSTEIYLASPTEEASRNAGGGRLKFTLDDGGRPVAASLVRGEQEVWRATRE